MKKVLKNKIYIILVSVGLAILIVFFVGLGMHVKKTNEAEENYSACTNIYNNCGLYNRQTAKKNMEEAYNEFKALKEVRDLSIVLCILLSGVFLAGAVMPLVVATVKTKAEKLIKKSDEICQYFDVKCVDGEKVCMHGGDEKNQSIEKTTIEKRYCEYCRSELSSDSKKCPNCGASITSAHK